MGYMDRRANSAFVENKDEKKPLKEKEYVTSCSCNLKASMVIYATRPRQELSLKLR